MTAQEFVSLWKAEAGTLKRGFLGESGIPTYVSDLIRSLQLSSEQQRTMGQVVEAILADTMYTLLLGLDGSASIGGVQATYTICDENGIAISSCGDLEAEAGEQFGSGPSAAS